MKLTNVLENVAYFIQKSYKYFNGIFIKLNLSLSGLEDIVISFKKCKFYNKVCKLLLIFKNYNFSRRFCKPFKQSCNNCVGPAKGCL